MRPLKYGSRQALAALLLALFAGSAAMRANAQFAGIVATGTRYAGNSTGSAGYSADTGTASGVSVNAPSAAVFDSAGNLFLADTQNNCIRKVTPAGAITTVAGLRVSGNPDTCNAALNTAPTAAQGLLAPSALAIDSSGTLYIADSGHNCVRTLAPGAVDTFAANALATVAGTCGASDAASVTPAPKGLVVDFSGNLYISIADSGLAVNQVLLHASGSGATAVCILVGQPSAVVATPCTGITDTATLTSPAGLALDAANNLYIADTGDSCIRELAGLTTLQTIVGKCANDGTGPAASLVSPYGLAVTPAGMLLISESAANAVLTFNPVAATLVQTAGLPQGASGSYSAGQEGQSELSIPLNTPLGLATDSTGNIYLADSKNNVIRKFSTSQSFPAAAVGSPGTTQTLDFTINSAVNLTASVGADYAIGANTCTGALGSAPAGSSPNTCQIAITFVPTRPGTRASALTLKDSISGSQVSIAVTGTGTGSLALLSPGIVNTIAASLRAPIAISVDSGGNSYVLEQGDAASTADILLIPAGGGAPSIRVPQGGGISTPTAMAVDAAGNIFVADASTNNISRFGADGSVNLNYALGISFVSAMAVDAFDNLYIAQAGSVHNVIEIYAGGQRRTVAGSGSILGADGAAAASAQFSKPSGVALGPNGIAIADSTGQLVYLVDASGIIHIVAGNGTSTTTNSAQATGTALLYPVGLAYDAAGDLYIADSAADRVFEVLSTQTAGSNISVPLGNGSVGYSGDGGPAPSASLFEPFTIALDGSSNLFVVDFGNSAVREVTYPTTRTINFGDVVVGNSPTVTETVINAGNAGLTVTTPITTTDTHYTTTGITTTCSGALAPGATCGVGYTFTPTTSPMGIITATSTIVTSSFDSPFTINLTGNALVTQNLPFTLPAETEVYGQPFNQTVVLNTVFPDLPPVGTMSFTIGAETTCTITSSASGFGNPVVCAAQESGIGVGTYPVNYTFTSTNISYYSTTGTTTLTITPAPLTVTPSSISKPYGAPVVLPNPPASIVGEVNGDVFVPADSTTAQQYSTVGTYPISTTLTPIGLASLANYNITYLTGTLTIFGAPLTVTVNNLTRPYGAANPTLTGTVNGAQNGDTFNVTYSTTATPTSPVGTYPITATVTGANIGEYSVSVVAGTLTITPIPLTVNVASASRPYGTANPGFSATISGAINGDTFTQSLSTPATLASPVGAYAINDLLSGSATANYTITYNPGTLTITPATGIVTVAANNASRAYGSPNPVFTSTVTGALNGDTFTITYSTAATPASPVGSYPITPIVSGPAAANYTIATSNATLSVTPAALAVTANNASRVFNTANPVFTGTVAGLLNGDTVTVTYATTATQTSSAGTYPIVPTVTGTALSNYTLNAINGTLTITPPVTTPLTVTVNNVTRGYGSANPVLTGTVSGLLNGDAVTVVYATAASISSDAGTYPITATVSGAAAANYTITVVPGTLTVTQAATATTIATTASPAYYGNSVTFTATVTSSVATPGGSVTFLNGSTVLGTVALGTNGTASFTSSALLPGNLTITANYSGTTDYAASSSNLTQVISAGSFTIAATPATQFVRGAGTSSYTLTVTPAQGFNGPVTLACSGQPADATCSFANPTVTVPQGGSVTTTMTVTNTAADATLILPAKPASRPVGPLAPIAFAAAAPFELTGLGILFAWVRRRDPKVSARSPRIRLFLLLLCTAGIIGLSGCACFTSVYKNYTITVTGTTTVPSVAPASTSVILSVGQQ